MMYNPLTKEQFLQHAQAYADGELDAQTSLFVTQYLAQNPDQLKHIADLQKLGLAAGRALASGLPKKAPDSLKASILAIADQAVSENSPQASSPQAAIDQNVVIHTQPFKINRQLISIAALVVLSISLFFVYGNRGADDVAGQAPHTYFIDYQTADALGEEHNQCARKQKQLYKQVAYDQYNEEICKLIAKRTGCKPTIKLDLSKAGYKFERFGNCPLPGKGAMHLIYKSTSDQYYLSVWVTPHRDGYEPLKNVGYNQVTPYHDDSRRPIMAWKDQQATYYFVGDDFDNVKRAANESILYPPSN